MNSIIIGKRFQFVRFENVHIVLDILLTNFIYLLAFL